METTALCSHLLSLFNTTELSTGQDFQVDPTQLAALMDSFATSQSCKTRCPLSGFIPHVCQAGFSGQHGSLSTWKERRGVSTEQRQATCRRWVGTWEPSPLRSSENRRIDRLKRLNSETQLSSPETD